MAVLTAVASRPVVRSAVTSDAGGNAESSVSPPPPPPSPRLTRVILPRKKPQKWSTGTAPGEYGGPPTTTKLRKYWGGGDVDPVAATDDFIWNKEFVGHMKRLLGDGPSSPNPLSSPVANVLFLVRNLPINLSPFLTGFFQVQKMQVEQSSGFLCLNRAMSLDSVEIDLSKELGRPPRPVLEQQVEAARRGCSTAESPSGASSPRWRLVPTRREQAKWDRADKVATGGSDVIIRESTRNRGDPRLVAAISKEAYLKLKKKLQILTLGIGGIGIISAYVSYNPAIAASFGAGLLGSLIYIRMLGNTIDSMADGAKGLVKGAAGQPRLLVPVALVMIYSRWNEILVPDYGFMHLELIPMLVGFFTYKVATFVQAIQDSITVVEERS